MEISSRILGGAELINAEEALSKSKLETGMIVADFGCGGRAYFALQAAKMVGKDGLIYAIDILKNNLKSVEELAKFYNIRNIKTLWADLEIPTSTKLAESSVDFVIITNLFFQTKKHRNILEEAKRILKTGGRVFVADWSQKPSPIGPSLELRADKNQLKKIAQEIGFFVEDEFEVGPYHFGLSLIKK